MFGHILVVPYSAVRGRVLVQWDPQMETTPISVSGSKALAEAREVA